MPDVEIEDGIEQCKQLKMDATIRKWSDFYRYT